MTNGNGAPARAGAAPAQRARAVCEGLFVRKSERAAHLAPQQQQPSINIQINVTANNVAETDYEVMLSVEGKAENAGTLMFSFDLVNTPASSGSRTCRRKACIRW